MANVARGSLIGQCALIEVLLSVHLRGAGLDVFDDEPLTLDSPLQNMWNVVRTPHWAAATRATASRRARIAGENVARMIQSDTSSARTSGTVIIVMSSLKDFIDLAFVDRLSWHHVIDTKNEKGSRQKCL